MNPTQTTTVTEPTTADVLRRAADYLDRYGWIQGAYYCLDGKAHPAASADGAIAIVAFGEPVECPGYCDAPGQDAYLQAVAWLGCYLVDDFERVCEWNDHRDTTGQDVVDTLREAADTWEYVFNLLHSPAVSGYELAGGEAS